MECIFRAAASLISYFLNELIIKERSATATILTDLFLFLWCAIVQTQYRNIGKRCEEILRQGKDLHKSWNLRKVVANYKTTQQTSSFQKIAVHTRL